MPAASSAPASKHDGSFPPECSREAQAAEHPSNEIEEREGDAHLKACIRQHEEKKAEDAKRAQEQAQERAQDDRSMELRRWVRRWQQRCTDDLSNAVCSEAPKEASKTHVAGCGRGGRGGAWCNGVQIGETAKGTQVVCGEDCGSVQDCESICGKMIDARVTATFEQALKGCLAAYVERQGKGTFACEVSLPKTASVDVATPTAACSKTCNDQGPEAIVTARESEKADKEGPALALAFRKCMVAADSTPLARKYQAYDRELYTDLLSKAVTTCRKANRCDWVEKYSKNACDYSAEP